MKTRTEISIVVPVYNVELYLQECLESIATQTFTDFELILIDDGSTDNSGAICDEYAKTHDFIRVFHQTNQGQSAARNFGVGKCSAEWVMFVDSDDVIHPQMLEFLYRAVVDNQVLLSACNRHQFIELPEDWKQDLVYYGFDKLTIDEKTLIELRQHTSLFWTPYASLINKSIVERYPFEVGRIYEDNAICNQWLCAAGEIVYADYPMYYYRDNPHGTMRQKFTLKKLDYLWALRQQLDFYSDLGYYRIFNLITKEYVGTTVWMCDRIEENLHDKKTEKATLKESLSTCKHYKAIIEDYSVHIRKLRKRLHPGWYRIKKAVKNCLKPRT